MNRRERLITAVQAFGIIWIAVAGYLIAAEFNLPVLGLGMFFLVVGLGALAFGLAAETSPPPDQ